MKTSLYHFILATYVLAAIFLLLYSYTQVDLGLTLSRVNIWQSIQKSFQYIGYFQRPLSTLIYLGLLGVFYSLYFWILILVKRGFISNIQFWKIIFLITAILIFTYPAFSYDLFNYMFDAKTILVYHKIPYQLTPLAFTGIEPWLSFLHWTHVPSIYPPLWLIMTLPAYLLGFGFFLLTVWNFKLLIALFYLLAVWAIGKVLERVDRPQKIFGMTIFALNPLVMVESLVSGHNDIVMMALALFAMAWYLRKKPLASFVALSASIAIKWVTAVLLPVIFWRWDRRFALVAMLAGFFVVLTRREVMPWYLIWLFPFVALLPRSRSLLFVTTAASLGLLLRYAPFLYFGHWNDPVPAIKAWVTTLPIVFSLVILLVVKKLKKI